MIDDALFCMKETAGLAVCEECRKYSICDHTLQEENARYAVEALEKQIPKKPIQSGVTDKNGVFHPTNGIDGVPYDLCPSCRMNLCTTGVFSKSKPQYCPYCGQRLKWSDIHDYIPDVETEDICCELIPNSTKSN